MVGLALNDKSLNCPGIFLEKEKKRKPSRLFNLQLPLSFICSSYITEALRNDSPEEGRVRNEIMPSVLGHVACQLYSSLQWSEMISESCSGHTLGEQQWLWCVALLRLYVFQRREKWNSNSLFNNKLEGKHKITDNMGCFCWSYHIITDKHLLPGSPSSMLSL